MSSLFARRLWSRPLSFRAGSTGRLGLNSMPAPNLASAAHGRFERWRSPSPQRVEVTLKFRLP